MAGRDLRTRADYDDHAAICGELLSAFGPKSAVHADFNVRNALAKLCSSGYGLIQKALIMPAQKQEHMRTILGLIMHNRSCRAK